MKPLIDSTHLRMRAALRQGELEERIHREHLVKIRAKKISRLRKWAWWTQWFGRKTA